MDPSLRITVVGLGKIGLPLAAQFASKGHTVVGADIDPKVVATVSAGKSHVIGEEGLDEAVHKQVASGRLTATTDTVEAVRQSDAVLIIVPLMVDGSATIDYGRLDEATRAVSRGLQPGTLVVYETTVPVGTTRGRLAALLQEGSGIQAGRDFFLAFSPERVYSGRIFQDLRRYPKIVGGIDAASTERAVAFYRAVLDAEVVPVANADTAEFVKLAETSYRDANIALANQLALYGADRNVNAREAFRAANSQPFSHLHSPSIGVGGHCIPVYPHFLLQDARPGELTMLAQARETNDAMAGIVVDRLGRLLDGLAGRRVLVLGLSYRENVKELAFSTAIPLIRLLLEAGALVTARDPLFSAEEVAHLGVELCNGDQPLSADAIIIQAFHREFDSFDWGQVGGLRVVVDGRGALDPGRLRGTSAIYLGVGVPLKIEAPAENRRPL